MLQLFFSLLFVIEIIAHVSIVASGYEEGIPGPYWSIGGTTLLLGVILLIYAYRKAKKGGYSEESISKEVVTPSTTLDISNWKLFKNHLIIAIVLFLLASVLIALGLQQFATRSTRITNIVVAVILLFAAILNIIIFFE